MSHEIRTPLNGILGMSQLMQLRELDDEMNSYLNTIISCSDDLLKIIDNVLELSKNSSEKSHILKEKFNIDDFMGDIKDIFYKQIKQKNLNYKSSIDSSIPINLFGDKSKFKQVILNLLDNAIKFTEEGDVFISIDFDKRQGEMIWLRVSVCDTGIGISVEEMDQLFKPFTQLDSGSTRKFGGNGLGLSVCKKLVDETGGNIWFESAKKKGSRFVFTYNFQKSLDSDNIIKSSGVVVKNVTMEGIDADAEFDKALESYYKGINCREGDSWNSIINELDRTISILENNEEYNISSIEKLLENLKFIAHINGFDSIERIALKLQFGVRSRDIDEIKRLYKDICNEGDLFRLR